MDCDRPLIKILIASGCLPADVDPIVYCSPGMHPVKALAQQGLLDEDKAIEKIAARLRIEALNLNCDAIRARCTIDQYLVKVSSDLCLFHKAIPLYPDGDATVVAFANPLDIDAQNQLRFALGTALRIAIAKEDQITELLMRYFPLPVTAPGGDQSKQSEDHIEIVTSQSDDCDLDMRDEDAAPVVKLINHMLTEAVRLRAGDVHFDATPNGIDVRYRIDGEMQHIFDTPKRFQRPVVSRVKLLAGMNIAESRAPQDGRFRIKYDEKLIDLRVSCVPTAYGEKIVIRILRSDFEKLNLASLGIPDQIRIAMESDLSRTGRIILVTGPTGSGKTTTLYAALKLLCDGTTNIETVEDPIEYKIPGVNQIQMNEAANITFAGCLRSILRQDPDVIMVGEIRDAETAGIALQAAQTGHLVLSTLHTNDAPSAISRLLHLGCDPFIIANSLVGVLAQRLVRRICLECAMPLSQEQLDRHAVLVQRCAIDPATLRTGNGCERCRYTGYFGRVGIYSYFRVTPRVSELIDKGAAMSEIVIEAKQSGFLDIDEAALEPLRNGVTTLTEVIPFLSSSPTIDEDVADHLDRTRLNSPIDDRTTLLLVEDDGHHRANVAHFLRMRHFRVIEAENGIAALQLLKEWPPDVVVTGLGLPDIDGKQLMRLVREQNGMGQVPVLVLTSADSDENEAELLRLGADDFVSRSRGPDVLIQRIERTLRKS